MPIDAPELARLIDRHGASLQLWVRSYCESSVDVVQEAFAKLAIQDPPPHKPVAWLYQVSRNLALKQRLSDHRRRLREKAAARPELIDEEIHPVEVVDLIKAVEGLDDELREILVARIWGQLSLEEIGNLCGISTATAFRRYNESIKTLRSILEPKCENRP